MKKWLFITGLCGVILVSASVVLRSLEIAPAAQVFFHLLGYLLLGISIVALLFLLARRASRRLFFKVRNKIILNYILTGVLPLLLVLGLVAIGTMIFMVQFVSFYFEQVMEEQYHALETEAYQWAVVLAKEPIGAGTDALKAFLDIERIEFPGIVVAIFPKGPGTAAFWTSAEPALPRIEADEPLNARYLVRNDQVYLTARLSEESTATGYIFELAVPLTEPYLKKIGEVLHGQVAFEFVLEPGKVTEGVARPGVTFALPGDSPEREGVLVYRGRPLPGAKSHWPETMPKGLDYLSSYMMAPCLYFAQGAKPQEGFVVGLLRTKYSSMLRLFAQGGLPANIPASKIIFWLVMGIAALFACVEIIALTISVFLSRSITGTIHQLDRKTACISRGDFSYKIQSKRRDQLGELARSFDRMSEDLEKLLQDAKEKERLEKEIAIAKEVQGAFFPRKLPAVPGIRLFGKCLPARMVSGDYYDFIDESNGVLDFLIGDISGKGISAALLMAGSQTFLRLEAARRPLHEVRRIVSDFNAYLVERRSGQEYSSLFYGRINIPEKSLTYCNAGHPPPFLFRNGRLMTLTAGGRPPGMFPSTPYEQETVPLREGDRLAAFTDGFTEALDTGEAQFGADRLANLLVDLRSREMEEIFDAAAARVSGWSASTEQSDDMTMLLLSIST
jgi:sigma-B regulation protein RsbU (phosphoserine phosphatase)